ncbi:MAG: hypothetical protein HQ500_00960 [Flavobacteriales bacterium]|nr:hypothetical protein [Flavobacteriales bacterium]
MIRAILAICSLFLAAISIAQTNTLSPYSIYGIGDTPYSPLTAQAGMAHTNLAILSTYNINLTNPANVAFVSRPTFNFDFRNELLSLSSNGATQTNNLFSIENFSFAFPLINNPKRKRRAAFGFGLKPYSRQGYDVVAYEQHPEFGVVEYRFVGEGGINSAFFGAGFDLLADSGRVNTLTIGAVGSYVFGSIFRNRMTLVDSSSILAGSNLYREEQNEISAGDMRAGILYTRRLDFQKNDGTKANGSFSVGGYFQPSFALNTNSQSFAFTFDGNADAPHLIDTLDYGRSTNPTIAPASFGIGIGMTYDNRINAGIDVTTTQWSALEIDGVNAGLNDDLRFSGGIEYTPDPTSYKQMSKIIRYRAGLSYEQTRLNVNGIQPSRIGISGGLGIPVIASRSSSMLNIGIEYARRGSGGLPVTENYLNFHIGLTITPNQFDRWFAKRKYD